MIDSEATLVKEQKIPNYIPLLPLKNVVMLPKSIQPILVGRKSSIDAVEYALNHDKSIFISAQKDANMEQPIIKDVYEYGTRSTILQVMRMPNGTLKIFAEGVMRAKIFNLKRNAWVCSRKPLSGSDSSNIFVVYCSTIPPLCQVSVG